jgi:hypothetical protein
MMFTFKTEECRKQQCKHKNACPKFHRVDHSEDPLDKRRDPRRKVNGVYQNEAPWAYADIYSEGSSKDEAHCLTKSEFLYHPQQYKTKDCTKRFTCGKCNSDNHMFCAFRSKNDINWIHPFVRTGLNKELKFETLEARREKELQHRNFRCDCCPFEENCRLTCPYAHDDKEMDLWREARQLNNEGPEVDHGSTDPQREVNSRELKFVTLEARQEKELQHRNFRCDRCQFKENCRLTCPYAHDDAEMNLWRDARRQNSAVDEWSSYAMIYNPSPPVLCRNLGPGKNCSFGYNCNFPHSEEELKRWTLLWKKHQKREFDEESQDEEDNWDYGVWEAEAQEAEGGSIESTDEKASPPPPTPPPPAAAAADTARAAAASPSTSPVGDGHGANSSCGVRGGVSGSGTGAGGTGSTDREPHGGSMRDSNRGRSLQDLERDGFGDKQNSCSGLDSHDGRSGFNGHDDGGGFDGRGDRGGYDRRDGRDYDRRRSPPREYDRRDVRDNRRDDRGYDRRDDYSRDLDRHDGYRRRDSGDFDRRDDRDYDRRDDRVGHARHGVDDRDRDYDRGSRPTPSTVDYARIDSFDDRRVGDSIGRRGQQQTSPTGQPYQETAFHSTGPLAEAAAVAAIQKILRSSTELPDKQGRLQMQAAEVCLILYKIDRTHKAVIAKGGTLKDLCHRHPGKIGFKPDAVHTGGYVYLVGTGGAAPAPLAETSTVAEIERILRNYPDDHGRNQMLGLKLCPILYKIDRTHKAVIAKGGTLKDLCHRHPGKIGFKSDAVHTGGYVYLVGSESQDQSGWQANASAAGKGAASYRVDTPSAPAFVGSPTTNGGFTGFVQKQAIPPLLTPPVMPRVPSQQSLNGSPQQIEGRDLLSGTS